MDAKRNTKQNKGEDYIYTEKGDVALTVRLINQLPYFKNIM